MQYGKDVKAGMKLQRLRLEAGALSDEDWKLIVTMLRALKRVEGIVENIRLYAQERFDCQ